MTSPLKRSNTIPNLRSKENQIVDEDDGEDEDEETLQLQLAEIKARLKLKKLQQKNRGTPSSNLDDEGVRPNSEISALRTEDRGATPRIPKGGRQRTSSDGIQVPASPTRREVPAESVSPRRYVMGIDKGWKANDVSLKRPPISRPGPRPSSQMGFRDGVTGRSNDIFSSRPQTSPSSTGGINRIKSFSERMAEGRAAEKSRLERAERVQANRSSAFEVDKAELEAFKAAASDMNHSPLPSLSRERPMESFSREDILRSMGSGLQRSDATPNFGRTEGSGNNERQSHLHRRTQTAEDEPVSSQKLGQTDDALVKAPDSSKFESYSSLHLSSRVLPHSFLSRTLAEKRVLRIPDLLKTVKAPAFELPEDIDGDFVVFGIVASKSDPRDKKASGSASALEKDPYDDGLNNTNRYMAITLTDLKWTIDLFLFDTAFPRYYKISEGTLVAILNPTIMPPPKHKLDTNRFSLSLSSSDDKVLEIGKARDIGFCKAVRKDGKTCQSWIDGRKTEFCDFHVDIQIRRTQGQRSGVNADTGVLGPGGKSGSRTGLFGEGMKRGNAFKQGMKHDGPQYDMGSQSLYYVAPSRNRGSGRSPYNPRGGPAANLIDAHDDPFIASGMMGRGMDSKEERMRRRLATQQRERDITQKLVSGRVGGVGAEYLRTRTSNESPNKERALGTPLPKSPTKTNGMDLTTFGKAKNVRLSPMKRANDKPHGSGVKKTRFITSRGIREAGRESLGAPAETTPSGKHILFYDDDDDDDDDLEFI
ncbi:DNA replication protein, putative [Penicillium digitatum]|uniref:DNA replication protein, putative n=3 Tax=Penicillium digitatum TaxID=36651 RepID=K9FXY6_PEND2|nr:DNA replication protein, putative [Penicillium digitatum Pd1]EKV05881.1 DNA replication protein, putative [Penicillium digitatum PHI26]EKV17939.1 DNA replication protein, putative [Penicillium digitatum Pd1]QQK46979.1 DNA replication protein, putative [Penicillium digitatum]